MDKPLADIATSNDVDQLVRAFYQQVLTDSIIGFFFTNIAVIDLEQHLPVISAFWQKQLLGKNIYHRHTFKVHQHIHRQAEMTEHHFHRWLYLFHKTIDELFAGPRATLAKNESSAIAESMLDGLQQRYTADIMAARELKGVQFFENSN